MAGINAALSVKEEEPLILDRSQAYIGVLIDDLVTKGTKEPYRMFTSRAEYRLLLREDNAALRLTPIGRRIGLVSDEQWERFQKKTRLFNEFIERLKNLKISPSKKLEKFLKDHDTSPIRQTTTAYELLRRPQINIKTLCQFLNLQPPSEDITDQVEIEVKYQGYIKRQEEEIKRFKKWEQLQIPRDIDYSKIPGLSKEVVEKLQRIQPESLGRASRISGVTPASITAIQIYLKKMEARKH